MFLKCFTFNDKCKKNITNEHINEVRGKIHYLFKVAH